MSATPERPILYSFRRCPYAMRARLAVWSAGQTCELREVVLRDKPPSLLTYSPKGTVPVLVLPNGDVIDESLDIMHWALGCSEAHPWLAGDQAMQMALIERNDTTFKHHLDRYKYPNRYDDVDALAHRAAARDILHDLDGRLGVHRWLAGDQCGLADMALAPFIRQFANHDRAWFNTQPWPHLIAWLDAILESDSFAAIMHKYPQWHAGEPPTLVP